MKCSNCGHNVNPGEFCNNCGTLAAYSHASSAQGHKTTPSYNTPTDHASSPMDALGQPKKTALPIWVYVLPVVILLLAFIVVLIFTDVKFDGQSASKEDSIVFDGIAEPVYQPILGEDPLLIAKKSEKLYYLNGEKPVLLSESAADTDLFFATEQIADGTFFVVDNLKKSESPYQPKISDNDVYRVGDLVMITPDGVRTHIDESVYEVVYSIYDEVCYYQVVEKDRQKLCVVKGGVSYDLTGWVDENIQFAYGATDGSLVYFHHLTKDGTELCIGQNGSYTVEYFSEYSAYWITGEDKDPITILEYANRAQHFSVYKDGEIVMTLQDGVNWDINYINSNLIIESIEHELILCQDSNTPIVLDSGIDPNSEIALVDARGYITDWLLYTKDHVLYILNTQDRKAQPIPLGPVKEWYFSYDPHTQTVYITGSPTTIYTYVLGEKSAKEIPFEDSAAYVYHIDGMAESFYYFSGDASTYDYTLDTTDLYYYNGSEHILLMRDASWYVGVVTSAFEGEKVLWLADGELYMANADGTNQQTVLSGAWWVAKSGDNIYGISYEGEVYLIFSDGSLALLMDGVDDVLVLDPEW
ncbi:MAG: zinc ribbon domain-containing protein [Eubacteriales bacterium]